MAQIIDKETFTAFWRDEIVGRSNALQSFVDGENVEAYTAIKSPGLTSPFLVLFAPEFKTIDNRSTNVQRSVRFGFWVVKAATKKDDKEEIKQLKQDCIEIVEEIIGRLDYLNTEKEFFGKYHADNTDYQEIEKVFDNHHGCQCFGEIITKTSIKHDATKWT
ncbi:MAG: hypothetical protein ACPG5W_02685 [Flavobacteriales bacterium]